MGFLSDGANNFFSSVNGKFGELATGANPLTSPVFGELFGFNIPGVPIVSSRDYFLLNMESWISALPMQTQWIVLINGYPQCLNTSLIQSLENVGGDKKAFDINRSVKLMTSFPNQKVNGCIFAQGVNIPGDQHEVENVSVPNNRGFVPGVVAGKRLGYVGKPLTIEFRETNVSFTDFVIRPWMIMGSHYGYVARNTAIPSEKIKKVTTDIMILQFAKTYQGLSQVPRKVWKFYNCAPYQISPQQLTYDKEYMQILDTEWVYSHYTVENNMYLPIPDLIDKLRNFNVKEVTGILFPSL